MLVRSLKTVSDVRFVVPSACSLSSSSASATRTFAATSAELLNPLPRRAEARSGASECVDDDASAGEDAAQPMRIVAISSAFTMILVRELQKPCRLSRGPVQVWAVTNTMISSFRFVCSHRSVNHQP